MGGQGGSRADVSGAEDGRPARKDAVPWMPLLQPGVGRGGEENRDKIKLQTGSAWRHVAVCTANRQTDKILQCTTLRLTRAAVHEVLK